MPSFRSLLLLHGYAFLFWYVFATQTGVPMPADPLLLIMGALVGEGRYSIWIAGATATAAALIGDTIWFELGRRRGRSVLALLCRLSIEPDTCVRKAELNLTVRGLWGLLFAKFIPGMSLISMPLLGAIRLERWRFLLVDAAGCSLWTFSYLWLGKLFHHQIGELMLNLGLFGRRAGLVALLLLAGYLAFKFFQRWRFRRELRISRISPLDAFDLMQTGDAITMVDLRNPAEIEQEGLKIAGALVLRPEDLRSGSHEIPQGNEVILYCS